MKKPFLTDRNMSRTALGWDKAHESTSPVGCCMPKESQVVLYPHTREGRFMWRFYLTLFALAFFAMCYVHKSDNAPFFVDVAVLQLYGS